jgi:hypothetical protein
MSATIEIARYSGASGTPTIDYVTAINSRHNTSDTHATGGTASPIPIPTSGSNFSYWQALRLDATVTPDGTIDNLRWYSDGVDDSPAGVSWRCQEATDYVQATGTPGTTGLELNPTNYATLTAATEDLFAFTAAAPKVIAGSITNPSTGPFGSWFVWQVEVASTTAFGGAIPSETLSVVFDES